MYLFFKEKVLEMIPPYGFAWIFFGLDFCNKHHNQIISAYLSISYYHEKSTSLWSGCQYILKCPAYLSQPGCCSASSATSFASSHNVSLLHGNTVWVILKDARQVVVVSFEVSLSLPKLFFPLWGTQLKDYIVEVKSTSLHNLLMSLLRNRLQNIFTCLK